MRLSPWLRPVFFSLSRAVRVARDAGFLVEHTSFHTYGKFEPGRWNEALAEEILEAAIFHRPAAIVFDGNVPYQGLVDACAALPGVKTIWIRRGMWRQHHAGALSRASAFSAVVEPGELAAADDWGPTRAEREGVHVVEPVLMLLPAQRASKQEARQTLGLEGDRLVVALQLGAGNNFQFAPIRRALLEALLERLDCDIVEFASPAADRSDELQPIADCHRILQLYPTFRYSNAFDLAISAAGYNSFHENILGAVPTLFVPNEADEMDLQMLRTSYAERRGLARVTRAWDVYSASEVIAELSSQPVREEIRLRCSRIKAGDGALEIARFIEEIIYAVEICHASSIP
jgi:hypothetical protein